MSYWLWLPEDKTAAQITADIGCSTVDYSDYLRTFQECVGGGHYYVCMPGTVQLWQVCRDAADHEGPNDGRVPCPGPIP